MQVLRHESFLVILLMTAMPGCASPGAASCLHHQKTAVARIVQTGGPYALSRTLVIPSSGLLLGDAVEAALRPGIAISSGPVSSVPQPTIAPIADRPVPFPKRLADLIGINSGQEIETPAQVETLLAQIVKDARNAGLMPATEEEALKIEQRFRDLLMSAFRDGAFKDGTPAELKVRIRRRREVVAEMLQQLQAHPESAPLPLTASSPASASSNVVVQVAVVLTRRTGRRIVMPLTLVRSYIAGDIQLVNGDRIEIVPFESTSAGRRTERSDGEILITSWTAVEGLTVPVWEAGPTVGNLMRALNTQAADMVVLTRLTNTGTLEEYILPADNDGWLSSTYLQHADAVHFDVLELSPLIRNSRIQQNLVAAEIACGGRVHGNRGLLAGPSASNRTVNRIGNRFEQYTGVDGAELCHEKERIGRNLRSNLLGGLQ